MTEPGFEADPAELMLALATGHVLAAFVFFDGDFAFWAGFAVEFYVINISTILLFFLNPVFIIFTTSWNMSFFITIKTETISTLAIDVHIGTKSALLNQFVAVFVRAPFDASILIGEISAVPVEVLI